MSMKTGALVVGLGEVGKPLLAILSKHYQTVGIDLIPPDQPIERADVMHICYPYQIKDFIDETCRYVELFKPSLTVINSTVAVGTTRQIARLTGADVVHSPVRGKHAHMQQDMHRYTKFIGAIDQRTASLADSHFARCGLKTKTLSSPEATELGKLTETTYFGVLIAWAQEVERQCDLVGANYDEVVALCEEVEFFPPVKYIPGIIGGHCVMPNLKLLAQVERSPLIDAIENSNEKKIQREERIKTETETKPIAV